MALPTPGVTPANWGDQLNDFIQGRQTALLASGAYISPTYTRAMSTLAETQGLLRLMPLFLGRDITATELSVQVSTLGASATYRLGIYADTGDGYPGALVVDGGTVSCASTGTKTATISQALSAGVYWLGGALQGSGSASFVAAALAPDYCTVMGNKDANPGWIFAGTHSSGYGATCAYHETSVTGALPSTFTSTVTLSTPGALVTIKAS